MAIVRYVRGGLSLIFRNHRLGSLSEHDQKVKMRQTCLRFITGPVQLYDARNHMKSSQFHVKNIH